MFAFQKSTPLFCSFYSVLIGRKFSFFNLGEKWFFLLYIFVCQRGVISRLLSNKYLVIGGEISFSFYLIYLFIIDGYMKLISTYGLSVPYQLGIPVLLVVIISLSVLSYYYFEKPANRDVKRLLNIKNQ